MHEFNLFITRCGALTVPVTRWNGPSLVFVVFACLVVFTDSCSNLSAQTPQPIEGSEASEPTRTEAEQVLRLRTGIDHDEKTLKEAKATLAAPDNEFHKALSSFQEADRVLKDLEEKLNKLKETGMTEKVEALSKTETSLREEWKLARDRFDNAIKGMKQLREQVKTLPKKIAEDKRALDLLLGVEVTQPTPEPVSTPNAPEKEPKSEPTIGPAPAPKLDQKQSEGAINRPKLGPQPSTKDLDAVKKKVDQSEVAFKTAKALEQAILKRIDALQEQIDLESKTVQLEREKADLAANEIRAFTKELQQHQRSNSPLEVRETLVKKIEEAEARGDKARKAVRAGIDDLEQLRIKKNELLVEKVEATNEMKLKELQFQQATDDLSDLQNPFSYRNLKHWFWTRGPKLGLILVVAVILVILPQFFVPRLVKIIHSQNRKFKGDREARTQTLMGALSGTFRLIVVLVAVLMILDELNVPIMPLLSGAAVFGLAIAFATQHLLRDYANGFYILWEDQYGIQDVIEVKNITGVVEKITMRMTTIRSVDGTLHFVPNGAITTVSNMTHGWSRVRFELGVAYKENVDHVMTVIREVVAELRLDSKFGQFITSDPDLMGVDEFGESAVIIHFVLKTKPLRQWDIQREFLRRIKNRFDELGIEIPFPHRTVYHHNLTGENEGHSLADHYDGQK